MSSTVIISHKHKFIFIKTIKTAGTSIEYYLSQFCGEDDVLTPLYPKIEPHKAQHNKGLWNPFPELSEVPTNEKTAILWDLIKAKKFRNHSSAMNVKHRIPARIWNSYYKFCVDRNPWDKSLSQYHMRRKRQGGTMTFDQYLEYGKLCHNAPKYIDHSGNLMVDRVLKFESLEQDLGEVFKELSIPFKDGLNVKAKGGYRADRRPYQEVYTAEQKDHIAQAFSREIAMHGYEF